MKGKNERENCTLKDFTVLSVQGDAIERAVAFKKWLEQVNENDHAIYWLEAQTAVKPEMELYDRRNDNMLRVISFISNDYLGMSQHPETKKAGIAGVEKYGTGVCAAPSIGGYLHIHKQLEQAIADFTGQEDALIFSSGFGANVGVLNALLGKNDIAFVDFQIHTSAVDGLHQTNVKKVGHNDLNYLEFALQNERHNYKTAMLIIDGVYSQDGDIAPLPEIVALCKKHNVLLYLDDAHGMGVLGENGRGTAEHFGLLGQVDIISGTFSKSFGAVGGYVACSKTLADYLRYYANTTVFSAAVTPQVTCSVIKAIELLQTDNSMLQKLWRNVHYLKKRLLEEGFDIGKTESPILPIMVRDTYKVKETTRILKEQGIYALGLTYPAVANKDSRLRVSVLASHEKQHLDTLIDALNYADKILNIKK
ncbi:MAG: aminotransferase class I/II-fold pyridoxal phosphate-dependent enzyme [Bacteroidales bacterium]|jgi:glycine C-acetyltransferase|nr:aminotransferase class I/II-fold pyridoxal phosphate-dependent enzyme [Bacteroidales bacterium]